jgi:hypothetical protein
MIYLFEWFFTLQAFWWAASALLHVHPVDAGSWNPLLYHVWYRPAPCQGKGGSSPHMSQFSYRLLTSALYRKYDLCIPRNETARPQSQFLHSGFCERFTCIYSQLGLHIPLQENRWTDCGKI